MRTINYFIVRGRVGQAPKAFNKTAKINIATDRIWTDGKGERHEETDWVTVSILNEKAATWAIANVAKGDACLRGVPHRRRILQEGRRDRLHHRHHRQRLPQARSRCSR